MAVVYFSFESKAKPHLSTHWGFKIPCVLFSGFSKTRGVQSYGYSLICQTATGPYKEPDGVLSDTVSAAIPICRWLVVQAQTSLGESNHRATLHTTGGSRVFFHPDCTVGHGVSPGQLLAQVADYTVSGESHPALKTFIHLFRLYYIPYRPELHPFLSRVTLCRAAL